MLSKRLSSWLRSAKKQRSLPFRFAVERLEDRIVFDANLVVGRTLSAYFVGSVQNDQDSITYTVYNEQSSPVTGVLLTDTLASGVTFSNPSQQPDQNGQNLAWSLGTIQGYDRASVTITLSLPANIPTQLDSGAQAFATLNAGAVSATTPAATLTAGSLSDPTLLASTPDANTTDPYIQEEAAALDYNPQQIFNFLQTQIGYNSYTGSLRGARGTLWSDAGNSLDVASLGIALMRASGIPAQYESGTLSQAQAQQLILSMFPASDQTVGTIPAGTQLSDPANDPQLLSETESYYWFEFNSGSGMQAANPLFAGTTIGQTITAATGSFPAVPSSLEQTAEISLTAEIYGQADAALVPGSNGLTDTVVLDQTFDDVSLVGVPVSVGNFVTSGGFSTPLYDLTTFNYTPYIRLGDGSTPADDTILTGTAFQEAYSNAPLTTQVLTGLLLNVTLSSPRVSGSPQISSIEKTLLDRIGFAARQAGSFSINLPSTPQAAVNSLDVTTLDVLGGLQSQEQLFTLVPELSQQVQLEHQMAGVDAAAPTVSGVNSLNPTTAATNALINSVYDATFLFQSDLVTSGLAPPLLSQVYFATPRVIAATTTFSYDPTTQTTQFFNGLDILDDDPRVVVAPDQAAVTSQTVAFTHGFSDSVVEGQVLAQNGTNTQTTSAMDVLQAAFAAGINGTVIASTDLGQLDGLSISATAKARIEAAAAGGAVILVPDTPVTVGAQITTAWLQIDPATGNVVAVMEDGTHGVGEDYEAAQLLAVNEINVASAANTELAALDAATEAGVEGGNLVIQSYRSILVNRAANAALRQTAKEAGVKALTAYSDYVIRYVLSGLPGVPGPALSPNILNVFKPAFLNIINAEIVVLKQDPPLAGILLSASANPLFPNLETGPNNALASEAAGAVSGSVDPVAIEATGTLSATWAGAAGNAFQLSAIDTSGTVTDSSGTVLGTGGVSLTGAAQALITGSADYTVAGTGTLAFYGPAEPALGVSGEWDSYQASVTGAFSITITTGSLVLGGQQLPAGTYTITTTAAVLDGSGATTDPTFSGSASITTTGGTVDLGAGTGTLTVAGSTVGPSSGVTLDGYSGTIGVTATGTGTDAVTLSGNTTNLLSVSATPNALTTDQNTAITFQANVNTSLADTYTLSAVAPTGWTVSVSTTGLVTATPAPGLQSGVYPIQIVAQSSTDPNLVAQTTVTVTITPTLPGITFAVNPDPILTVPYNGAQIPSAFQASIQNLGPAGDTYNLTFANIPSGFSVLNSGTSVAVPAGQTGILGLYLQPNTGQTLPAPGTVLSFNVTATSTTDPSTTKTVIVSFTVPEIHALDAVLTPNSLAIPPGGSSNGSLNPILTLTNDGNVDEPYTVSVAAPAGLSLNFYSYTDVAPGASQQVYYVATIDPSVALNTTLTATITLTSGPAGSPITQTLSLPVVVNLGGVADATSAANTAAAAGLTDLAARISDLATAMSNLYQSPSDPVALNQSLAAFDAVTGFATTDPFLASLSGVAGARLQLATATNPSDLENAILAVGQIAQTIANTQAAEQSYGYTITLDPNTGVFTPGGTTVVPIDLTDTGSMPVTISLYGPNKFYVSNSFNESSVTLQPGQTLLGLSPGGVQLSITPNTSFMTTFDYQVQAFVSLPQGGSLQRTVDGSLTPRAEVVAVPTVTPNPPFTTPGNSVTVTAGVFAAVNTPRTATATLTVTNSSQVTVFTTSAPVSLGLLPTLTPVTFPAFDTTGLADGDYTLTVTVTETGGAAISGATVGNGHLEIGLPVTGTLTTTPAGIPVEGGTVTNTVTVNSSTPFLDPLTLIGQVATTPSSQSVALDGTIAYVAGSNGVDIVDVSNSASPRLISTFGSNLIVQGGSGFARLFGPNDLLIASTSSVNAGGFTLLVYDITNPVSPSLVSDTPIDYRFISDMIVQGNTLLVPTSGYLYSPLSDALYDQIGDVVAIDLTNLAAPVVKGVLFGTSPPPNSGNTNQGTGVAVAPNLALITSSTSVGDQFQTGTGQVLVTDFSDPSHLSLVTSVPIPGTNHAVAIGVQGTVALVLGSTGGWAPSTPSGLTGQQTLTALDISNPENPVVLGTTLVLPGTYPNSGKISILPVGNGKFAVSGAMANGQPAILLVDASDPTNLAVSAIPTPTAVQEMAVSGNMLYTTSDSGLLIYDIGSVAAETVTISVQVPTAGAASIVPGSFNIPPTQTIPGSGYETLEWDRTVAYGEQTFTWQSTVTGAAAGQVVPVTNGGTIAFTDQGTAGSFALPPTSVTAAQVISLTPAADTVVAGTTASYSVTVTDPGRQYGDFYGLSVSGIPSSWVSLSGGFNLGTGQSQTVPLTITPPADAVPGAYSFVVTATIGVAEVGYFGSDALGTLTVTAPAAPDPNSHGVVVSLSPTNATAGPGTTATSTAQLTNTGSADESYTLSASGLPQGVTATFASPTIDVPPGASNFRDDQVTLTAADGTPAATTPFTITATSTTSTATGSATGTVTVADAGVAITLDQETVNPGGTVNATVTNMGTILDTFDLALAGPGAVVATLGSATVTLAPGQSQTVTVATGSVNFATQGNLNLSVDATSVADPSVEAAASTALKIQATTGLTAALDPATQTISAPGTADFTIDVDNTGNQGDSYSATITGTTGSLTASLQGLDGNPTQSIPTFDLPGLANGALAIDTDLTAGTEGTVTVLIQSLDNPDESQTVTATVTVGAVTLPTPTVTLTSNASPGSFGQPITFTATVLPTNGLGTPTGSITFLDGNSPLGTISLTDGIATLTSSKLAVGPHTITASYGGNSSYAMATSPSLSEPIQAIPGETPTVTLTSSASPGSLGQPITFTATVAPISGLGTPTGSITFLDGTTSLATVDLVNGSATFTSSDLAIGPHTITAIYSGNGVYAVATSPSVAEPVAASREGQGQIYAVGAGPGGGPRVEVFNAVTNTMILNFFAFDSGERGGVSVATGDVTGNGVEDVIAAAGIGGGPEVEVFNGQTGALIASWFAYDPSFRGGVWVASEDLFGDGHSEIVTGPGPGGGPVVEVWSLATGVPTLVESMNAYDPSFRGGVTVATGIATDGRPYIVVGAGPGGGPRVRTFDAATLTLLSDVYAYAPSFTGGVYVASGDVLGTGTGTQILVGPGPGGGPQLVVLDSDGTVEASDYASVGTLRNGLTVAAVDQATGPAQVLIGAGQGAYEGELTDGTLGTLNPVGFFEDGFQGGVFVG